MQYLISPELMCLEKSSASLTLSHFGNVSVYNSLNPDLVLGILESVQNEKTLDEIATQLRSFKKGDVQFELKRLMSLNYINGFVKQSKITKPNLFLRQFAKNESMLLQLSSLLEQTKVTLIDLCYETSELKNKLEAIGFSKVSMVSGIEDKKLLSADMDYAIVIGDSKQKFQFSKINQILFAQKKPWLLVTLDSFGGIIGPTFGLAGGPCYDCIIEHGKRHRHPTGEYRDLITSDKNLPTPQKTSFLAEGIYPFICTELIKIISKFMRPASFDGFYSFDLLNFRMQYNVVSPSPLCPVCSKYS